MSHTAKGQVVETGEEVVVSVPDVEESGAAMLQRTIVIYENIMRAVFPFVVAMAGWGFMELRDHDSRLTTIEASRHTSADAAKDREDFTRAIDTIRLEMKSDLLRQSTEIKEELRDLRMELKDRP